MAESRRGRDGLGPQREPPARWVTALLVVPVAAAAFVLLRFATRAGAEPRHHHAAVVPLVAAGAVLGIVTLTFWALRAAPHRLDYRLRGRSLEVTTLFGRRRLRLASITRAEVVAFDLRVAPGVHLGWPSSHLPGYYVGRFPFSGLGRTRVIVGVRRGSGVMLHFRTGEPLLLAPEQPAALAALIDGEDAGRG
ncbi:MAG: hypothetical protein P8Z81_13530 [Deinococcales bacterium]